MCVCVCACVRVCVCVCVCVWQALSIAHPQVKDTVNNTIACQISPVWEDSSSPSEKEFQLVFQASLPPLSLVPYRLLPGNEGCTRATLQFINTPPPSM